jgi:hypothetical protein
VNFAIRFGLKVDTKAYDALLDQNLALTGGDLTDILNQRDREFIASVRPVPEV